MTTQEFSDQFDVLLNSSFIANDFGEQSSKIDIQLDEYEKSVFLTQAQEQLVINLYNGRNIEGLSFESAEESRRYLKELTVKIEPTVIPTDPDSLYPYSYKVNSTNDVLFTTRETAKFGKKEYIKTKDVAIESGKDYYIFNSEHNEYEKVDNPVIEDLDKYYEYIDVSYKPWQVGNSLIVEVIPITQDEYHRTKRNPYKKFNEERVLRIENNNEWILYSKYPIEKYNIDYIRKPKPIIVSAIGDMTIDNCRSEFDLYENGGKFYPDSEHTTDEYEILNHASECELNPILHRTILLEAVKLAKMIKLNQIRNEMLGNMPGQLVHPPMQQVNPRPN